jgi:pimeloyl-ACP methyl ester carboxylesterase
MPFMPFNILGIWLRGLLSVAILAGGMYLLYRWYNDSHVVERVTTMRAEDAPPDEERTPEVTVRRFFRFEPGWNRPTLELAAALALLAWATLGRWVGHGFWMLLLRPGTSPDPAETNGETEGSKKVRRRQARRQKERAGVKVVPEADEDPSGERTGETHAIPRPDGSVLRVECFGPADAPPVVLTHGWGLDSTEWFYQKRHLAGRFRLIVWDEPGLGLSKKPDNNDYRLENLAADLDAVLAFAGGRPAVLVGHSIGGMITLTFCKEYPEALGARVAGLVLVHTTYTNPVRTTRMAALYTALESPVLVPLLYLTTALWPLVWLMTWMSYLNGSAHRSTHRSSFSGNETRGQLDFAAGFTPHGRPDVLARGMLGMIAYDATEALARINVPTLVVVGDLDALTTPESGAFMAGRIPGAELVTLTPASHLGLMEHHDRFDRLVAEFAGKCQPALVKG